MPQFDVIVIVVHSSPIDRGILSSQQGNFFDTEDRNTSHVRNIRVWMLRLNEAHVERDYVWVPFLGDINADGIMPVQRRDRSFRDHILHARDHHHHAIIILAVDFEGEFNACCAAEGNSKVRFEIRVKLHASAMVDTFGVPLSDGSSRTHSNFNAGIGALVSQGYTRANNGMVMVPGVRICAVVREEKVLDSRRPHGSSDRGKFVPISGIDIVVDEYTVDCL